MLFNITFIQSRSISERTKHRLAQLFRVDFWTTKNFEKYRMMVLADVL